MFSFRVFFTYQSAGNLLIVPVHLYYPRVLFAEGLKVIGRGESVVTELRQKSAHLVVLYPVPWTGEAQDIGQVFGQLVGVPCILLHGSHDLRLPGAGVPKVHVVGGYCNVDSNISYSKADQSAAQITKSAVILLPN